MTEEIGTVNRKRVSTLKNVANEKVNSEKQNKKEKSEEREKNDKNHKKNVKKKNSKKTYSTEALQCALKAYSEGVSIRKAADSFGVPTTTIFRHYKNPGLINCRSGPPTVLSELEENEIVEWIIYRAERGFPMSKTDLLDSVQHYLKSLNRNTPFKDSRPGRHWYEGFYKRHPSLTIKTPRHFTGVRASVSQENLRTWFGEVETYLSSKSLIDIHPSRVFNCDEMNVQLCPKSDSMLGEKGAHAVHEVVDMSEKEHVTSLFMYNADGTRAPPMILYPYKDSVPKRVVKNFPSGWAIGISETGVITTETFYKYIANVFHPWLIKKRIEFPIILYIDGHSSYVTIPLVSFCRENDIELISLYPHATHILQPLDVGLFHPFKEVWKTTVHKWKVENNEMQLKKEQFPAVLKKALDLFGQERNIKSGFKTCGLMPFNPEVVQYDVLKKKIKNTDCKENHQLKENQQVVSHSSNEVKTEFLQTFESTLSLQLLQDFKNAESTGIWTGNIEQKGLFEFWLGLK